MSKRLITAAVTHSEATKPHPPASQPAGEAALLVPPAATTGEHTRQLAVKGLEKRDVAW